MIQETDFSEERKPSLRGVGGGRSEETEERMFERIGWLGNLQGRLDWKCGVSAVPGKRTLYR